MSGPMSNDVDQNPPDPAEKARRKAIREAEAERKTISDKLYDRATEDRIAKECGLVSAIDYPSKEVQRINTSAKLARYDAAWKAYQDPLYERRDALDQLIRDLQAQDPKVLARAAKKVESAAAKRTKRLEGGVLPTAECQVCEGIQATRDGKMVLHGYQRPGFGYTIGSCYGVNHAPFPETDALVLWQAQLKLEIAEVKRKQRALPSATVLEYEHDFYPKETPYQKKTEWRKVRKIDPEPPPHLRQYSWESIYERNERELAKALKWAEQDLVRVEARIALGRSRQGGHVQSNGFGKKSDAPDKFQPSAHCIRGAHISCVGYIAVRGHGKWSCKCSCHATAAIQSNPSPTSSNVYVATLINPVDHKPYAVTWNPEQERCYIVDPPSEKPHTGNVVGQGYFEDDESDTYGWSVGVTGCPRSHTPGGVTVKGAGLGLMLYSGLALTASYAVAIGRDLARKLKLPHRTDKECISSSHHGRSGPATKWWEAQAARGFVDVVEGTAAGEEEEECEEDSFTVDVDADTLGIDEEYVERRAARRHSVDKIESYDVTGEATVTYKFCTLGAGEESGEAHVLEAEKVLDSGIVLHLGETLAEHWSEWKRAPLDVIQEINLSGVRDWGFIALVEKVFVDAGASAEQLRSFLSKNVPFYLSTAGEKEGRAAGAYRGYARNPGAHGAAWASFYADLLAGEEILKTAKNPGGVKLIWDSEYQCYDATIDGRAVVATPTNAGQIEVRVDGLIRGTVGSKAEAEKFVASLFAAEARTSNDNPPRRNPWPEVGSQIVANRLLVDFASEAEVPKGTRGVVAKLDTTKKWGGKPYPSGKITVKFENAVTLKGLPVDYVDPASVAENPSTLILAHPILLIHQAIRRRFLTGWLAEFQVAHCPAADREHAESERQYAHVGCRPQTICFASAVARLAPEHQLGLILHEIGHLAIGGPKLDGRKHTEAEANQAARQLTGIAVQFSGPLTLEWAKIPTWLKEELR